MIDINLLNQHLNQQSGHDPNDMSTEYGAIQFGDENHGPEGTDLEGIIKTLAIFIPNLCLYFFGDELFDVRWRSSRERRDDDADRNFYFRIGFAWKLEE